MLAIYKKELRSYLCSMTGCVMIALTLAFIAFFATIINIYDGTPNFEYSLIWAAYYSVFIITVPFITMRSIAEERHSKTEQLLFSLPIPIHKIVLSKFFATLTIVITPAVISAVYPILFSLFSSADGVVNYATAYSGWLQFVLMLAAMTAIGLFASSLVENQIIAAVITAGAFLFLYFMKFFSAVFPTTSLSSFIAFMVLAVLFGVIVLAMTKNSTAACIATGVPAAALIAAYMIQPTLFTSLFPSVLSSLAFFDQFISGGAQIGVFDVATVVYYISFTVVFVFLTVESVERRRYN